MELKFVAGLSILTLVIIALIVYVGYKIAAHARAGSPNSHLHLRITMTGTVLYAVMIGFLIVCLVSRTHSPDGGFGSFMNQPLGLASTMVALVFVSVLVGQLLEALGFPVFERD